MRFRLLATAAIFSLLTQKHILKLILSLQMKKCLTPNFPVLINNL